jgi:hypothetical protein
MPEPHLPYTVLTFDRLGLNQFGADKGIHKIEKPYRPQLGWIEIRPNGNCWVWMNFGSTIEDVESFGSFREVQEGLMATVVTDENTMDAIQNAFGKAREMGWRD